MSGEARYKPGPLGDSEKHVDRLTSLPWSSQVLQQTLSALSSVLLDVSGMLDVYWIHESKTIQ